MTKFSSSEEMKHPVERYLPCRQNMAFNRIPLRGQKYSSTITEVHSKAFVAQRPDEVLNDVVRSTE